MNRNVLSDALGSIRDDFLLEAARSYPAGEPGKEKHMKVSVRKILRTVLIAAVLVSVFGATAYAAGWIGPRAIVIEDAPVYDYERGEDGTWQVTENPDGAHISMTQPQQLPEDLDPAIREKLEAKEAAWAEWTAYRSTRAFPEPPAVFMHPEGAFWNEELPQEDGTVTLRFYNKEPEIGPDGQPVFDPGALVEERTATPKDYAALEEYSAAMDAIARYESKYDFNYDCSSAEDEAKLEQIAASYGLRLRHGGNVLWSGETCRTSEEWQNEAHGVEVHNDFSGPQFLSNAELTARIAQEVCHGDFFYETPLGFDKFYYYDEGSFGLSWYVVFTPERQVTCYVYNASYGTLNSGSEIGSVADDISAFTERSHTCPDGTVITVLRSPEQSYFYVYLENSYLCGHIGGSLSESEEDAVLDSVCWSNIGK